MKQEAILPAQGRRYSRGPFSAPIACVHESRVTFETAVEISEGGLLVSTSSDYKIGEILKLSFFIPGVTSFEADCEVTYLVNSSGQALSAGFAGLRFLESNEHLSASIREFVSRD